jgi:hypothetical protein
VFSWGYLLVLELSGLRGLLSAIFLDLGIMLLALYVWIFSF